MNFVRGKESWSLLLLLCGFPAEDVLDGTVFLTPRVTVEGRLWAGGSAVMQSSFSKNLLTGRAPQAACRQSVSGSRPD